MRPWENQLLFFFFSNNGPVFNVFVFVFCFFCCCCFLLLLLLLFFCFCFFFLFCLHFQAVLATIFAVVRPIKPDCYHC